MIKKITLTGVDEQTNVDKLVQVSATYPCVEFGFLYTTTPEGRNRYPSFEWLAETLPRLNGCAALHVCGSHARAQLGIGRLNDLIRYTPRVQVNGILSIDEAEMLATRSGVQTLITQHTVKNAPLLTVKASNHCILIDESGGRGKSPMDWTPPDSTKPIGFAGGLGDDNLAFEMSRISPMAKLGAWIDMEGKLRTNDWFDLALAEKCAQQFTQFTQ